MHRRDALALLGTALAAPGCLGSVSDGATPTNGPNSPDGGPDPTSEGTPDCEAVDRPDPDPPSEDADEAIEPASYPDPPDSRDDAAISAYVEAFERAYRRNALVERYGDRLVGHGMYVRSVSTDDADGGAEALIEYNYSETVEDDDGLVVGDSPTIKVGYHVDERAVHRSEREGALSDDPPDPRVTGDLVACFE